ncbi:MAG TPA: PspC domain-containing protein [Candidatus Marinimicrobia bacterium]|mgnify:FL=1|jgi:phage shock protein PspC (stress-responsive transcriptional regulator)|nr:PspC domain-containing protein [Candidatus Neomarinimicrobiota bacterium]HJL74471.1 PspC domain-containing protein [Candidatus Neomarinimicrobiota bacterium]HJM70097.1 PspC domain-containing protein [Candidatus Neomarinimicrobiota bacterium]|tara:strand:+ start:3405 stop:4040 length:636 start_codon:yes stop_codon:yes gene_type:complete
MKRIIRSRKDRIIGGVCGGFAEYFGLDPSLIRLAWIFFTLFGGSGILAYLLAMIVIPDEFSASQYDRNVVTSIKNDKTILWGVLLVFVGLILFFMHNDLLNLIWRRFWDSGINLFLAIVILGLGIYLLYTKRADLAAMVNEGTGLPLHLSKNDNKVAGVCGGIAESIQIDSTLIRFLWVFGTFMSAGIGILLYLVLALILPSEPSEQTDRI